MCATSCKRIASAISFEGVIEMSLGTGATATTTVTEVKGLGGFVTITDMGAKKTWMLDSSGKTYTETDLSAAAKAAPAAPPKPPAKLTKTGRSDKIAGYACDVYAIDEPASSMHTEACVASGISLVAFGLTSPFAFMGKEDDVWAELVSHGFPLRVEMMTASGAPFVKMEATRVEKKSLPDSDFQVPPGYTKMKI
jgi:hypothetical protein